jgi:NADH dehydrogenase
MSIDNLTSARTNARCRVIVIGGGFAGIAVVRELRDSDADVTLVDRNNHHLFQPFLFQVATSILEPSEIATPIRSLLSEMQNVSVEMREAKRVDMSRRVVVMSEGDNLPYDVLVIATGAQASYFGHESEWAQHALGLKTLSDAIAARNRLLTAFERAAMESDPAKQARDMTVVIVGGGPTGVAITGTISEFVQRTLPADFRNIDMRRARIVLVEAGPRLLQAFSEQHSSYARQALERAGVEVRLGVGVTHVDATGVTIGEECIEAATVLWCTGVQGVTLARTLGVNVKANGTVAVEKDFSVPGHPDCFVVGDAAYVVGPDGRPIPGLASVAQHQGHFVGKLIAARLAGSSLPTPPQPFVLGKLATITRHVGIAEYGDRSITGFPAWLMWGLLHLRNLSGGHSKLSIVANWLRLLVTYRRSARLIVEPPSTTAFAAPPSMDNRSSDNRRTCAQGRSLHDCSAEGTSTRSRLFLLMLVVLFTCTAAFAQQQKSSDTAQDSTSRVFQLVLPSDHVLGDWGGVRPKLEESGITPRWFFITDVAGNPSGGRSQGATQASSTELSLLFDLNRIVGLKGGSVFASFSQRWGNRLSSNYVGNVFSEQQIYGFETFRVIDVSYQQKLFKDRLELRLGRFAATDNFLDSPYNYGFMSNAFCGNPFGILLDAPGMTAYTGTWAALGKVKPTRRSHLMTAIYNGDKNIRTNKDHGVNLSMNGPLFAMAEVGYQINGLRGDSQRLGNYKLGGWYDDATLTDLESGARKRGSRGFYGLFDQVLVPFGSPRSNRGLGIFGSVTVAPDSHVQQLPLYFTAGASARGPLDARPRDAISVGVATGYFSDELQRAQRNGLLVPPEGGVQDHETVVELTYRFDLRRGAYFIQPDFQYIVRPGGTGHLPDAPVFGAQFGINF